MAGFNFQNDNFKGPLEMLLELVEARKMHISDIALSEVADKFIAYTEEIGELPIADTANFVYIASILILIKSKSLLPGLDLSPEETASVDDLERRLALLKLLRDQAPEIRAIFNKNNIYEREESRIIEALFVPPIILDVNLLLDVAKQVIASVPVAEKLESKVIQRVVSIEEMIGNLSERINKTLKMSFRDFSGMKKEEKVNVIVSFLAMLELVKRGIVNVTQHQDFADIEMESTNISTPTYS